MAESITDLYHARLAEGRLRPDPVQAAVMGHLQRLAGDLAALPERRRGLFGMFARPPEAPRGVYLWGGVGRGKSMLMDLFVEAAGPGVRRVHFHAFMQEVQKGLQAAREAGTEDALAPVAEAMLRDLRCLAFDEMQITDIADAMIVGRLFDKLFAGGVAIVATSNRVPEDLYKDGLNRQLFLPFIALIRDRMEVVALDGPTDYRQHRLTGAQVYFHPAGRARGQMDAIWADLTGGARGEVLRLPVNGRVVEVPRYASGVGRASFWELCARPLGPADYLAVAEALRVLMLDDIPSLSSGNYNEAKRFVTLIDALYEARVRLVASAADEPERLYIEGEGSFEFARTASRLREMQAAGWGKGG